MNKSLLFIQKVLSGFTISQLILTQLFLAGLFILPNIALAATITSTATGGAWTAGTTWVDGTVPAATDIVVIVSDATITTGGNRTCAGITITGTLTMSSGDTLTVNGDVSGAGTWTTGTTGNTIRTISLTGNWSFNGTTSGSKDISATFTGTNAQTLSGKIQNGGTGNSTLTINKTGGSVTLGNALTVDTFTFTAGTFDASTYLLTATTRTFTAGTLRVGAATWAGNYSGAITEPAAGIIEYYAAGAQTVNDVAYPGHLTISGFGTKTLTLAANRVITGNLTIGSGAIFTTAGNFTFGVTGATSVTGTLTLGGTGTKTFTGNVTINSGGVWNETGIAAINYAGNLQNDGTTFTANTGVHTFSGTAKTISGTSAIAIPNITISGTRTNNGTLSVSTTLEGASTLTNGVTGTLNFSGTSIIPTLTATAVGNTVNYTGVAQTIKATIYNNLTLSGSGTKTLGGATTVNDTATINAGVSLDVAGFTFSLSSATLVVNGTLDFSNANGSVMSTAATSVLTMGSSGVIRTIDANGVGPATNASLIATATFTTSSIDTDGTVEYYRSTDSTGIVTDRNYNNLTITGSTRTKTWTLAATRTINGNVTINSGAPFTLSGAQTVNVKGNWSNSGTFTAGASTINFNGATQTINNANTWYNLSVTGATARTVTLQSGVTQTVTNGLTLTGASGQLLTLVPSASPAKWQINVNALATQIINYVSSSYSDASGGTAINAADGTNTNGGNNTNWNFSYVATVTSGTFTVDSIANTITGVPFGISKADFLAALTKGQADQTWNDAGIVDPVVSTNVLVVTAQDGTTVVTYIITVNADPDIALLAAAKSAAHDALTNALDSYTLVEADYTPANFAILTGFKTAGDTAIDEATDSAGVTSA